ncbi:MAG: CHAT domain-containing protein, partial [Microcoleaceae cyanobacterium]
DAIPAPAPIPTPTPRTEPDPPSEPTPSPTPVDPGLPLEPTPTPIPADPTPPSEPTPTPTPVDPGLPAEPTPPIGPPIDVPPTPSPTPSPISDSPVGSDDLPSSEQTQEIVTASEGEGIDRRSTPTVGAATLIEPSNAALEVSEPRRQAVELARVRLTEELRSAPIEEVVPRVDQFFNTEYGIYLGLKITEQEIDLQSIQSTLGETAEAIGQNAGVLYALIQDETLELILVTANSAIRKTIAIGSRAELIETANQFITNITSPRELNSNRYQPYAEQLYQWLIAPIEAELKAQDIDTIMFAMDRRLRGLPLAALHDGEQFLVENYSLSLIPSFSLTDTRYQPLRDPRILAMGASTFPNSDQQELPAVPLELQNITDGRDDIFFLNEEFTQSNFKNQSLSQSYDIIHLATHSEFQVGNPQENSYILFWDSQITFKEIKDFGWESDSTSLNMLVLSACRTATGDDEAELGFAGSAVQTGVPSVLASLWYVSDVGTLGLMTEFYNQLSKAPIKVEAFRQAQISMLLGDVKVSASKLISPSLSTAISLSEEVTRQPNEIFSHPYYWAGFMMVGRPW